jgi:hypothetical protein
VSVPLAWYLVLAALLFAIGAVGALTRRNGITIFLAFGLSSVRERLGGLGGKMEVRARRGGGTSVVLEVPLGERTEDGRR